MRRQSLIYGLWVVKHSTTDLYSNVSVEAPLDIEVHGFWNLAQDPSLMWGLHVYLLRDGFHPVLSLQSLQRHSHHLQTTEVNQKWKNPAGGTWHVTPLVFLITRGMEREGTAFYKPLVNKLSDY